MTLALAYTSSTKNLLIHVQGVQEVDLETSQYEGMTWVVVSAAAWMRAMRSREEHERISRDVRVGRMSEADAVRRSRYPVLEGDKVSV